MGKRRRTDVVACGEHPFAADYLQPGLAALWPALSGHSQRRFRRRVKAKAKAKVRAKARASEYVEFVGRSVEADDDGIWLMREDDTYWMMPELRFLGEVQRFWEAGEIDPDDPGGWGF